MKIVVVVMCAFLAVAGAGALAQPSDAVARLLAGRDASPTGIAADHARRVSEAWAGYERNIGGPLRQWAAAEVDAVRGETVFYPFSGPDFPTVNLLYPGAARYVLVANQYANAPPALDKLEAGRLVQYLDSYARHFGFYAQIGFFRTNDLDREAARAGLRVGVTDLLMGFASRLDHEVLSVEPIQVRADGADVEPHPGSRADAATWRSVRLVLRREGRTVLLDYVRADLSDGGLARAPALRAFVDRMAAHRTVFKAASHLPQRPQFAMLRAAVLARAPSIVQDETGIDYALLEEAFDVTLYGRYARAHHLFSSAMNKSLAEAYRDRGDVRPLGFRVGYEKRPGSAVQVAMRREASDIHVLERRVAARMERYAARPRVVYLSRGLAGTPEEHAYLDAVAVRLPQSRGATVVSIMVDRNGAVLDASVDKGSDERLGNFVRRMDRMPVPPASVASRGDAVVVTLNLR